jgi:hypothetical protein
MEEPSPNPASTRPGRIAFTSVLPPAGAGFEADEAMEAVHADNRLASDSCGVVSRGMSI